MIGSYQQQQMMMAASAPAPTPAPAAAPAPAPVKAKKPEPKPKPKPAPAPRLEREIIVVLCTAENKKGLVKDESIPPGAQKFKRDFARLVSAATDDKGKSCTRMLLGELKAALDAPGESVRVAVPCMTLRMTFWSQMS